MMKQVEGTFTQVELLTRATERLTRLLPNEERDGARSGIAKGLTEMMEGETTQASSDALLDPLRWQARKSLMWITFALTAVAAFYIWLLAWTLIPIGTATTWLGRPVPVSQVNIQSGSFHAPTGTYILVASVLGVVATGVLLASTAVDEDYARRFTGALLRQSTSEAFALAIPYLAIRGDCPTANTVDTSSLGDSTGGV